VGWKEGREREERVSER
jgi:hypothetical protein